MITYKAEHLCRYEKLEAEINLAQKSSCQHDFFIDFLSKLEQKDREYHFIENLDSNFIFDQIERRIGAQARELHLVPFGVKDVFNTLELPTTLGSEVWKGFRAGNNARMVDELVDRGAIVACKTTTAEFAVHYFPENRTLNPLDPGRITGTSSAGSAVAVASGALPIALGTQTAGSIIRPASFCGVVGFKPTFGALDRTGVLKTSDTLDTLGFLASDVFGIRKFFSASYQKQPENYYHAPKYVTAHKAFQKKSRLNIAVLSDQFTGYQKYDKYVGDNFEELCAKFPLNDINIINFPKKGCINEVHYYHNQIYEKSLAYYFQREISRGSGVSQIMLDMVEGGKKTSIAEYQNALSKQVEIRAKFEEMMQGCDFVITPSCGSKAPLVGQSEKDDTCLIWTFVGFPSISVPIFWDEADGLPFGLQIVAPRYHDFALLDFADQLIHAIQHNAG